MLSLPAADLMGIMGTLAVALALVAGAALALWSLPWSDAELDQLDADAQRAAKRLRSRLGGRTGGRWSTRFHAPVPVNTRHSTRA